MLGIVIQVCTRLNFLYDFPSGNKQHHVHPPSLPLFIFQALVSKKANTRDEGTMLAFSHFTIRFHFISATVMNHFYSSSHLVHRPESSLIIQARQILLFTDVLRLNSMLRIRVEMQWVYYLCMCIEQ